MEERKRVILVACVGSEVLKEGIMLELTLRGLIQYSALPLHIDDDTCMNSHLPPCLFLSEPQKPGKPEANSHLTPNIGSKLTTCSNY